jgi:ADP-heptose:LPS heptosyltransferase
VLGPYDQLKPPSNGDRQVFFCPLALAFFFTCHLYRNFMQNTILKMVVRALAGVILWEPVRRLFNPNYKKVANVEGGTVCIVLSNRNRLGDLVIHNFLVQQLRRYGYSVAYGMTSRFYRKNKSFFENHSETNNFVILPQAKREWVKFVFAISKKRFNAVIFDTGPLVSPAFFYLAGVPAMIVPEEEHTLFYTKKYFADKANDHYTQMAGLLLEALGPRDTQYSHTVLPFFKFRKTSLLQAEAGKGCRLAVHMGGDNSWNRKWPEEKFLTICTLFLQKYDGALFLVGGAEERAANENVKAQLIERCNATGRVFNCCGDDLNTTANVLFAADVCLGNDSGPMHIANALNKPVLVIFGPSPAEVLNPATYNGNSMSVQSDLPCAPCKSTSCSLPDDKQYSCLKDLPVAGVWHKLQLLMDGVTLAPANQQGAPAGQAVVEKGVF